MLNMSIAPSGQTDLAVCVSRERKLDQCVPPKKDKIGPGNLKKPTKNQFGPNFKHIVIILMHSAT